MNKKVLHLLEIASNQFDYFEIVEIIENATIKNDNDKGCGLWQENFTILPNISRVKEIIKSSKPIAMGKYWMIFNNNSITDNMQNNLEKEGFWLLDYISKKDFIEDFHLT